MTNHLNSGHYPVPTKEQQRQSAALAALRRDMALMRAASQAKRRQRQNDGATMGWPVLKGGA